MAAGSTVGEDPPELGKKGNKSTERWPATGWVQEAEMAGVAGVGDGRQRGLQGAEMSGGGVATGHEDVRQRGGCRPRRWPATRRLRVAVVVGREPPMTMAAFSRSTASGSVLREVSFGCS